MSDCTTTLDEIDYPEWEDEDDEEAPRCRICDQLLRENEPYTCDDCTGLRHCIDDMCHGLGYCMHDPEAIQP